MLLQFNACTMQAHLMVVLLHLHFKSPAVKVMGMVQSCEGNGHGAKLKGAVQ